MTLIVGPSPTDFAGETNSPVPPDAVQIGGTDGTNLQAAHVYDTDTGGGTEYTLGATLRAAAPGGSVETGTSTHPLRVDPTGTTTQPVSVAALPLPAGAATEATLATMLTQAAFQARINTLGQKVSASCTPVVIASDQSTLPISAASLPLPTGAATEATLSSILAATGPVGAFQIPLVVTETPALRMQLSFPYNINTDLVKTTVANGGTVTQANSTAVLQTSAAVNGSAILQSYFSARYTPGQGQVAKFTTIFDSTSNINFLQEQGIGDLNDGLFFAKKNNQFGILRRRGGVDVEFVDQGSWNGVTPGGFTPYTNGQVYAIRFQWLGYGDIYYCIEDPLTGKLSIVHTIKYPGTSPLPTIFNPTLPLWARVANTGNASNISLVTASMGVYTEGPLNHEGVRNSTGNRKSGVGGTLTNIFTLRNNATVFGGKVNRAIAQVDFISTAITGSADSQIQVLYNATLGGVPSFADISTNTSIMAIDTAGTTVTGGRELVRIPSTGNFQQFQDISGLNALLAPGDTLTFAARSFGANISPNIGAGWHELV